MLSSNQLNNTYYTTLFLFRQLLNLKFLKILFVVYCISISTPPITDVHLLYRTSVLFVNPYLNLSASPPLLIYNFHFFDFRFRKISNSFFRFSLCQFSNFIFSIFVLKDLKIHFFDSHSYFPF